MGATRGAAARRRVRLDRRIAAAPVEELAAVEGVGDVIAQAVREYFDRRHDRVLLDKLRSAGVRMSEERAKTTGRSPGKTFVITGRSRSSRARRPRSGSRRSEER